MAQIYKPTSVLFKLSETAIPDAQTLEKAVLMQMQHQMTVLENQQNSQVRALC